MSVSELDRDVMRDILCDVHCVTFRPHPHISRYFFAESATFFFSDTASDHTHPANLDILEFAFKSGI